jgi:hypothetical protein
MSDEVPAPEDRTAELERRLAEVEASTHARLVRAELKVEAIRAGMIDLDGLKLLDLDNVKLNSQGEVEGASLLMRTLRASKPWLFGAASSSSASAAPPAQPPAAKQATEMTYGEWQAAKSLLLKKR